MFLKFYMSELNLAQNLTAHCLFFAKMMCNDNCMQNMKPINDFCFLRVAAEAGLVQEIA